MTDRSSPRAPDALRAVAGPIEERIDALLRAEIERWSLIDPSLAEPLQALQRFVLSAGKRLRPAFCHWTWVGTGGDPADRTAVDVGAALELLHAFALIHDDVMDGSERRRSEPTVHARFRDSHASTDQRGESRRFGEGVAILIGDLAEAYADQLVTSAPRDALAIWSELKIELNIGQFLDMRGTARRDTDLDVARRIARYKSGMYTIERPLQMGAALAGRLDDLGESLLQFGRPLGEAFQLRDDVLGVFGDPIRTGKPVGDDLREGKPTPLLAVATRRADRDQRATLARVGDPHLDDDAVQEIQSVLIATGALDHIEETIDRRTDEAIAALDRIGLDGTGLTGQSLDALRELAVFVSSRDN